MAANFQFFSKQTGNCLNLKLYGIFDGNSAFELIHVLLNQKADSPKIFIDTNGLHTIHSFGRDVFQNNRGTLGRRSDKLIFVGKNKHHFAL
jgi:anti-anti-sigma regulatory factor